MNRLSGSIGIFDSGVGGLSVMREMAKELPQEDVVCFADSVHCPYGRRSHDEIQRLARGIVTFLLSQGAKVIVVACNTGSAAALHHLRETFSVPIVGMEPAVKPAAERTDSKVVGVMATEATFQGTLFASLVERFASDVEVLTQTCPGLVEQVETGRIEEAATMEMLRRYVQPVVDAGVDSLVLGCTHYPFLKPLIREIVGEDVETVDPSAAVARQTRRVLARDGLVGEGECGRHVFYTTGDPEVFARLLEGLTDLRGPVLGVRWLQGEVVSP
jgi:glutamate racemase